MEDPEEQERDCTELYGNCAGIVWGCPTGPVLTNAHWSSHCGARLLQTFRIYREANLLNSLLGKSSSSDKGTDNKQ